MAHGSCQSSAHPLAVTSVPINIGLLTTPKRGNIAPALSSGRLDQWRRHIKASAFVARFIWKFLGNQKLWDTAIALLAVPGPAVQ